MGKDEAGCIGILDQLVGELGRWDACDDEVIGQFRWSLDDAKAACGGGRMSLLFDLVQQVLDAIEAKASDDRGPLVVVAKEALRSAADTLREGATGGIAVDRAIDALTSLLAATAPAAVPIPEPAVAPQAEPAVEETPFQLLPDDADRELLAEYVTENLELLQGAEAALLTLETDPEDAEAINTVFRAFHTIKGTSAFIGITPVAELAHKAETLLSRVRDKQIRYGGLYADLALRSADLIKELMGALTGALAGEQATKPAGYDELIASLCNPEAAAARLGAAPDEDVTEIPHIRMGDILMSEGKVTPAAVQAVADTRGEERLGIAMVKAGVVTAPDVADALRKQKKIDKLRTAAADSSVRVRTDRLDRLIEMVGELVIAHSMVAQDPTVRDGAHFELARKTSHMGKIVRELQDLSMAMRMVPLKSTFQKMARLVRDVSQKIGKEVEFTTEGEETEIDRNMVDLIGDPLVHMIRNSVDHGVEAPQDRVAAGKARQGHVHLSACHSGGSVVVTITDDGRGLDRDKIVRKAVSRGLIDNDKGLSDNDVYTLLFEPGFSTAEKVTDVSGRGVGLDVVKRNVESMRGRIDIRSELGRGTTFTIYLPLTLAITDGMLIRVGAQRYILPTANIAKTFRPTEAQLSTVVGTGEMVFFQDTHVPIFRLARLFHIEGACEDPTGGLLVVIRDGVGFYALLADEIIGQQQIVAKSLGEGIPRVPGVSGGAILADGKVGLIIDPPGLGALARRGINDVDFAAPAAGVA